MIGEKHPLSGNLTDKNKGVATWTIIWSERHPLVALPQHQFPAANQNLQYEVPAN